jgi:vacuolar protein sorting-associated protein 35
MRVMDELSYLESHVFEEHNKKKRIAELYELVQHCGNVLPRLYLLVTVGSAYIRSMEAPAKHVLRDMVEMCRGVQHPTRGLFLRDYLTRRCKDKLPDKGNQYESPAGGNTRDAVEFVLNNFVEMNKLWVRMQHQVNERDREQRERERRELCTLVGFNLHRLAQLDGVTIDMYKDVRGGKTERESEREKGG